MRNSILHISNKLGIRYRLKNQAICIILGVILLAGISVGAYFFVKFCLTPPTSGKFLILGASPGPKN